MWCLLRGQAGRLANLSKAIERETTKKLFIFKNADVSYGNSMMIDIQYKQMI